MAAKEISPDLSAQLQSGSWQDRRQAARALATVPHSEAVVLKLREMIEDDPDMDVRATAVGSLSLVTPDDPTIVPYLSQRLGRDYPDPVRLAAALALSKRDDLREHGQDQELLINALVEERLATVQIAIAKAVVARDPTDANLRATSFLAARELLTVRAGALLQQLTDADWAESQIQSLLTAAARMKTPLDCFELDLAVISLMEPSVALSTYQSDGTISDTRAALALLFLESRGMTSVSPSYDLPAMCRRISSAVSAYGRAGESRDYPSPYYGNPRDEMSLSYSTEEVAEAREGVVWPIVEMPAWPNAAVDWLSEHLPTLPDLAKAKGAISADLWLALPRVPDVINVLLDANGATALFSQLAGMDGQVDQAAVGRALLTAEQGRHLESIRDHAREAVPYLLATLRDGDWRSRQQAADWFAKRASVLESSEIDQAARMLTQLQDADPDEDVRNSARAALIEVTGQRRRLSTAPLVQLLRGNDDEKALEALEALDRLNGADAPRALVNEWVTWLTMEERTTLVESAAEKLRRKPSAVLPILDQLTAPLAVTPALEESLRAQFTPEDVQQLLNTLEAGDKIRDVERLRLQRWLSSIRSGATQSAALVLSNEDIEKDELDSCIQHELELRRKDREVDVRRRLSRHLNEMSEPRFFERDEELHESVLAQLRLHAVPILARRLQEEEDIEVRESIARTLGTVSGREAVDALARAVAGEERTRASRQDLLSRYYLEPSKSRSDEAAEILQRAVRDARHTLRVLQVLNFLFAGIGLTFLGAGLGLLLFSNDPQLQFAGGAISVVAFFGLVVQIVREPLDRIQEAMNRLVQLETAFTSFIWELNLNGTFVQSQYVANGILSSAEISDTVERIEGAMRLSMDLVSTYADRGSTRIIPAISSVVPGVLHDGDRVRVRGVWLSGGSSTRRAQNAQVQLDHRAIAVQILQWTDGEAEFRFTPPSSLPTSTSGGGSQGLHWLSLSVNGVETNALPVQLG